MPLDDLLISTGVDNLIKLVHERGRVDMRVAASELRVPLQTIEDWSHVLESEGIIKIQYQLTQVFLVWASMSPAEFERTSRTVNAKKSETLQKLQGLSQTVDQSVSDLDELKGKFGEMQRKTRNELDMLNTDRAEADRLALQATELIGAKSTRLEELKADLEKFHTELEGFQAVLERKSEAGARAGRGGASGGRTGEESGALDVGARMESLTTAQGKLEERIRTSDESFNSLMAQIAQLQGQLSTDKSLDALSETKTAIEDLKFARSEMAKTTDTLRNDLKSLGAEIDTLTKRVNEVESKKTAVASPKKMVATLEALSKQAARERESTLSELTKNLEAVRKQIQAYSQAQYQYQTIKTHLESLQMQYTKESEELEQFLTLLEGATGRYAKDLATAKGSLSQGQKEYETMLEKARSVQAVLTQIDSLKSEGEQLALKLRGVLKEAAVVAMQAPVSGRVGGGAGGASGSGASGSGAGAGGAGGYGGAGNRVGGASMNEPSPQAVTAPGGIDNLPQDLVQRIALTTAEEAQFEKKREELRGLIKKMWEEDRKPPNA